MKNQNKSNNDDTNDTHYVQSMDCGEWAWAKAREVRADVHLKATLRDYGASRCEEGIVRE